MPSPLGIDVSSFELVDWQRVADAGVLLGIAKTFQFADDAFFFQNWEQIRNAGLLRGAYYFLPAPQLTIPTFAAVQAAVQASQTAQHITVTTVVTVHDYPDPHHWGVTHIPTDADVQAGVDHAVAMITLGGGLEPGDLPLILDAEDQIVKVDIMDAAGVRTKAEALYPNNATVNRWDFMPGGVADVRHLVSVALARIEAQLAHLNARRPMIYTGFFFFRDTIGNPPQTEAGVSFGEYPLWLANYGPLAGVQVPTPWLQNDWLLWQYSESESVDGVMAPSAPHAAHTCDANKLVKIAPDPAHAGHVILTESTDLTPLEALCGIEQRPNPVALARRYPAALTSPPTNAFNLLFVGQGFWNDELAQIVNQAWEGVHAGGAVDGLTDIPPFNAYRAANQPGLVAHFDAGPGVYLGARQKIRPLTADELTLWPDAADRIKGMLGKLQVHIDPAAAGGAAQDLPAASVWPTFPDQSGVVGTLVALLRKAQVPSAPAGGGAAPANPRPAELYKIDPSETYPVPLVAVNVTGSQWPRVLARAIAQILGGLADEYELDGADFAAPPVDLAQPYAPNLRYLSADQRIKLGPPTNAKVLDVVPNLTVQWSLPAGDLPFVAHKGTDPNPDWSTDPAFSQAATKPGQLKALEGGNGYRSGVLRTDFDCLMRRMPSSVAAGMAHPADLPIQSTTDFCATCLAVVRRAGQLSLRPRIRLDSQRLMFDAVKWPKIDVQTLPFQKTLTATTPTGATWTCSLAVNAGSWSLTDLKLDKRDDPYDRVSTIFSSVTFQDFSATLGTAAATPLAIATALGNHVRPPKLEIATDGGSDNRFQIGIKLTLSWTLPTSGQEQCVVDGILSVVCKGQSNDADPHGFTRGCRVYPQIALRARPRKQGVSIGELRGTVRMVAANAIPATQTGLDPALQPFANGKIVASLFAESNTAGADTKFAVGAPLHAATGRKLAALQGVDSPKLPIAFPPPHWSWRFDYARPLIPDPPAPAAFALVHRADETAHAAVVPVAWPTGSAFQIPAKKETRQGDYDTLSIHPSHGSDSGSRPVVAAPFSADLGILLTVRRGLSTLRARRIAGPFVGWGAGRGDQGARSVKGAPMVPPNQHVDLTLHRINDGQIQVDYAAQIRKPGPGDWQVILEQGVLCAFRYILDEGLTMDDVALLNKTTGAVNDATLDALRAAYADKAHPAVLDSRLRAFYQALFGKLRFYDSTVDSDIAAGIQQVPDVNAPPASMEKN
jgi:GH25 family lysozyme M1 (1,4-beta-N-acetylmuramidase)